MDFLFENQLQIIDSFVKDPANRLCYIAVENAVCKKVPEVMGDAVVIDLEKNTSPYKPFLDILRELKPSPELVHKYSYSVLEESLSTYLRDGYATERYDLPNKNDIRYETNRLIKTICSLISELNHSLYVIQNAQNIFDGTIQLLKVLEKTDFKGQFVFCFNSEKISGASQDVLNFLEEFNNHKNFLYMKNSLDRSFTKNNFTNNKVLYSIDDENIFADLFKQLRNNRIFMAYSQLKHIVDQISYNMHRFNLTDNQKRLITFEMAVAKIYTDQYDDAIILFAEVVGYHIDDETNIASLFYLTMLFYRKKSNDMAQKYSLLTTEKLNGDESSPFYTLHKMVEFQFTRRSDVEELSFRYVNAFKLLEEKGFTNNYITTGLSVPWDLINVESSRQMIESMIEKCYQKAKEIDNQQLVSKACHWKGIMLSHYGQADEAMKWHDECNRIRTEIGEIGPILNIRNGLSYENTSRAMYKKAYNLGNEIIKNLYNIQDYSTVIDTLKNVGYALFYSRHFSEASIIFDRILHYLNIFGYETQANNSFLPSTGDMLIFKTIIDLDRGDYVHGKTNYSAIALNIQSVTMEDKPLVKFLQAILYADEGEIPLACDSIDACIKQFSEINSNQKHKICFCSYEFACILERLGHHELSEKYLNDAHKLALESGMTYYSHNKDKITLQDYVGGIEKFEPLNIDLAFLDEKAEKEVLVSQLHKRLHDYQFLNKLKSSSDSTSFQNYISEAILNIYEYSVAEFVALCEFKNGKYQTIASINRNDEIDISPETWKSIFVKTKESRNCEFTFIDEGFSFGNLSQFDYRFGILILQGDKTPLTSDIVNTLNIALSTIQAQITIYKQNENLMFLSTTDQLSLLNNRRALTNQLNIESEKLTRTITKNKNPYEITIAFMDMDNFKFYNDNFGHSAGDLLINRFAKLLKNTCRQTDFVARFGGDEFVIVMNDTSIYEVENLFKRIKDNLDKLNYFIPDLEAHLNVEKLDIESGKRLGFSMGISTNFDIENVSDLETVLHNADKALYYTKEHCKGGYSVWEDVKRKM